MDNGLAASIPLLFSSCLQAWCMFILCVCKPGACSSLVSKPGAYYSLLALCLQALSLHGTQFALQASFSIQAPDQITPSGMQHESMLDLLNGCRAAPRSNHSLWDAAREHDRITL
eukprot:scaffold112467_cov18-Tisochrysis_lutea.AAC.1